MRYPPERLRLNSANNDGHHLNVRSLRACQSPNAASEEVCEALTPFIKFEELNEKLPCSCTTNASQMVHRANMAMIVRWKILVFVTKYRSLRRLLEFGGCLTKTHSALLTEFERHRPFLSVESSVISRSSSCDSDSVLFFILFDSKKAGHHFRIGHLTGTKSFR